MSTLWTPGGEIPIRKTQTQTANSYGPVDPLEEARSFNLEDLSPEERERAEQAIQDLAETRKRLMEVPASTVVANHAMGLYELAALHLADKPPNFAEATVAIDAMSALVEGMTGRLGEPESTLNEGLNQIRIAFVKLKQSAAPTTSD